MQKPNCFGYFDINSIADRGCDDCSENTECYNFDIKSLKIEIGGIYQHYRNQKLYKITDISKHPETGEMIITYCGLDLKSYWQPMWRFGEKINNTTRRFTKKQINSL